MHAALAPPAPTAPPERPVCEGVNVLLAHAGVGGRVVRGVARVTVAAHHPLRRRLLLVHLAYQHTSPPSRGLRLPVLVSGGAFAAAAALANYTTAQPCAAAGRPQFIRPPDVQSALLRSAPPLGTGPSARRAGARATPDPPLAASGAGLATRRPLSYRTRRCAGPPRTREGKAHGARQLLLLP